MPTDYQAAQAEQARVEGVGDEIAFDLAGETFVCAPTKLAPWVVLKLQAADEHHITENAQAVIAFFRHVVAPDDWLRFEAAAERVTENEEMAAPINHVIAEYAGRPTRRPASSPGGPSATGPSSTPTSSPAPEPAQPSAFSPVRRVTRAG